MAVCVFKLLGPVAPALSTGAGTGVPHRCTAMVVPAPVYRWRCRYRYHRPVPCRSRSCWYRSAGYWCRYRWWSGAGVRTERSYLHRKSAVPVPVRCCKISMAIESALTDLIRAHLIITHLLGRAEMQIDVGRWTFCWTLLARNAYSSCNTL